MIRDGARSGLTRARFSYDAESHPGFVVVFDFDGPMSVTNDAEAVVAALAVWVSDLAARRIVYSDTTGRWDEIEHEAGSFVRFRMVNGQDHEHAMLRVRERERAAALFGVPKGPRGG